MNGHVDDTAQRLMGLLFRAHPWHGVSIGDQAPEVVTAYIEIVPTDTVKYEVDKVSGFLKVDRPQRFSNFCPVYYGLVPQTYCGERVAALFGARANRPGMVGDGDPLDICVLTEKTIPHSDILLTALPIGGLSMSDGGEADDKIIAVLKGDKVFEQYREISELPKGILARFEHYFLTYKNLPDEPSKTEIAYSYDREDSYKVIETAIADYEEVLTANYANNHE